MAMAHDGRLALRLDQSPSGSRPDVILDVYRESTENRRARIGLWVPVEHIAPSHIWKHTTDRVEYEVAHPWIYRVGLAPGGRYGFERDSAVMPQPGVKCFEYLVLGDCMTTSGLEAPYDEEDTTETFLIESLGGETVFGFWRRNANQALWRDDVERQEFGDPGLTTSLQVIAADNAPRGAAIPLCSAALRSLPPRRADFSPWAARHFRDRARRRGRAATAEHRGPLRATGAVRTVLNKRSLREKYGIKHNPFKEVDKPKRPQTDERAYLPLDRAEELFADLREHANPPARGCSSLVSVDPEVLRAGSALFLRLMQTNGARVQTGRVFRPRHFIAHGALLGYVRVEDAVKVASELQRRQTGYAHVIGDVKNKVRASPDLLAVAAEEFIEYLELAGITDLNTLLFPWLETMKDFTAWRNNVYYRARERVFGDGEYSGIDPMEIGRHTFVSLQFAAHRPVKEIADLIGDKPARVEENYGHLMKEYRRKPPIDVNDEVAAVRLRVRGIPTPPTITDQRLPEAFTRRAYDLAA